VTSIRLGIALALQARLAAITGWSAALRGGETTVSGPVVAIVVPTGEEKNLANSNSYDARYRLEVVVVARAENADPVTDGGNGYRYLDRLIVEVERVVHDPDSWGLTPAFTDVQVDGHEVADPTEDNELMARVFLTFRYRHDYQDPEA
jgi:hypothetical protein